jgi:hypothetical protein
MDLFLLYHGLYQHKNATLVPIQNICNLLDHQNGQFT